MFPKSRARDSAALFAAIKYSTAEFEKTKSWRSRSNRNLIHHSYQLYPSAMNKSIQAAVLNNAGAQHLVNNNFKDAISCFRNSLSKAREVQICGRRRHAKEESPCCAFPRNKKGPRVDVLHMEYPAQTIKVSEVCKSVRVVSGDCQHTTMKAPLLSVATFCAIYNLALLHHLLWLQSRSPRYLEQALQYYEMSCKIQQKVPRLRSSHSHALCVLNNMAVIYWLIGDRQKSNFFLSRLYSTMAVLQETGLPGSQRNQWKGFLNNALFFVLSPRSFTAAAA